MRITKTKTLELGDWMLIQAALHMSSTQFFGFQGEQKQRAIKLAKNLETMIDAEISSLKKQAGES